MKKVIAAMLAAALAFSAFACTGKNDPPDASGGAETQTQQETPTAEPSIAQGFEDVVPTGSGTADEEKDYGGILRIVNTSEGGTPIGLPWKVIGIDVVLLDPYAESLLLEHTNGDIEPWLATQYEIDADALEIYLTLREGVKFHDGSDFNAEVCAWNLQQAIDAQAINPAFIGVEATGEYTVTITLDQFTNAPWTTLASHSFSMVSKENAERNGLEYAAEHPVGTGPFIMKEYVHGEKIAFEKNPNYWQDGKPYLDGIEYIFIRDVMTQNIAIQTAGEQGVDVLNTTSGEQIATLRGDGVYMDAMPIGPVSLIPSSMHADTPLSKLEVRQAISYAIDRDLLVEARGFGVLTPAYQFVPDAWGAHLPDSYNLSYDPELAKELLAQAGYAEGFTTKLIAMPGMVDRDIVVALQSMLGEVGINAELEFPDSGGYSNYRFNGWDGILIQHTRSLPVIATTFALYFDVQLDEDTGEYSYLYMKEAWRPDKEMYEAAQAAGTSLEQDDALDREVHRIIMENLVAIPMYNLYETYIIKNNVRDTGFGFYSAGTTFLPWDAWKSAG